jgi:hypothetical protein
VPPANETKDEGEPFHSAGTDLALDFAAPAATRNRLSLSEI